MEQTEKAYQTRQTILDESFKLFYENGFKATSVDTIMKATSLSKGAFYHHFKNKQEIGVSVISERLQQRVYQGMIAPLYASGNVIEILENTFIKRLKSFSLYEKQHGCPVNNLINEVGDYEVAYQSALKRIIEEWKAAITQLIDRGKQEGTIQSSVSSKAVAVYLISTFEGIRGIRKLYDTDHILDEYIEALLHYIHQLKTDLHTK